MRSASVSCLCFAVSRGEDQDALASLGSAAAEDPTGSSTRMEMQSRTAPQARPKAALLTAKGDQSKVPFFAKDLLLRPSREYGEVWGYFPTLKIITKVKWNWSDQMMIRGSWHRTALDVTVPGDRPKVWNRKKRIIMLKVKVRFTGKKVDIEKVVSFMNEFMDDDYTYKVLTLSEVSGFYPNRGSSEEGRVYCDFNYDPDIYHYEDEEDEC